MSSSQANGYRHDIAVDDPGPRLPNPVACQGQDTSIWFPTKAEDDGIGRRICWSCPGRQPCREWAIARPWVQGIWGATTWPHRNQARKCRAGRCVHSSGRCPWRLQ